MLIPIAGIVIVGAVLHGLFIAAEHQKKFVTADVLKGLAADKSGFTMI